MVELAVCVRVPLPPIVTLLVTMSLLVFVSPLLMVSVEEALDPRERELMVTGPEVRSRVGWLVPPFMMTSSVVWGVVEAQLLQFEELLQSVEEVPVQVQVLAKTGETFKKILKRAREREKRREKMEFCFRSIIQTLKDSKKVRLSRIVAWKWGGWFSGPNRTLLTT